MRVVEDEERSEELTEETQSPVRLDATLVAGMAIWQEVVRHPDKECVTSIASLDTRRKTVKVGRERESAETRCPKNGRNAPSLQASTDLGAPPLPQLEAEPAPVAQVADDEEAAAEPRITGP